MKIMPTNYNYVNQTNQRNKTQKSQAFEGYINISTSGGDRNVFRALIENVKNELLSKGCSAMDITPKYRNNSAKATISLHNDFNEIAISVVNNWKQHCTQTENRMIINFLPD